MGFKDENVKRLVFFVTPFKNGLNASIRVKNSKIYRLGGMGDDRNV